MNETRPCYAKIENGIVTSVNVVEWEFLVANPDRYGNSDLWLEVFPDNSGRGYCGVGWHYDATSDEFVSPTVVDPLEE